MSYFLLFCLSNIGSEKESVYIIKVHIDVVTEYNVSKKLYLVVAKVGV